MKIRITESNLNRIQIALDKANGKACSHTYNSANEVISIAARAEMKLDRLMNKKYFADAHYFSTSGDDMPNAYKYNRIGTQLNLYRGSSGWFLVGCSTVTLNKNGGREYLLLSAAQDLAAISVLRKQYSVKRIVENVAA